MRFGQVPALAKSSRVASASPLSAAWSLNGL